VQQAHKLRLFRSLRSLQHAPFRRPSRRIGARGVSSVAAGVRPHRDGRLRGVRRGLRRHICRRIFPAKVRSVQRRLPSRIRADWLRRSRGRSAQGMLR